MIIWRKIYGENMGMSNKGQMLVLETVFFAGTVILSLFLLYQLSPPTVVSNTYSYDLKIVGDNALYTIYNNMVTFNRPAGYPSSKLVHYLLTNSYNDLITDLNNMLPSTVLYNVYISNGTKTVFWCNSFGSYSTPLPTITPVSMSHCVVALNLTAFSESANRSGMYRHISPPYRCPRSNQTSDLLYLFNGKYSRQYYTDPVYDVKLEMWYT